MSSSFTVAQLQDAAHIIGIEPGLLAGALHLGTVSQPALGRFDRHENAIFDIPEGETIVNTNASTDIAGTMATYSMTSNQAYGQQYAPSLLVTGSLWPPQEKSYEIPQVNLQRNTLNSNGQNLNMVSHMGLPNTLYDIGEDMYGQASQHNSQYSNPLPNFQDEAGYQLQLPNYLDLASPVRQQSNDLISENAISETLDHSGTTRSRTISNHNNSEHGPELNTRHLPLLAPKLPLHSGAALENRALVQVGSTGSLRPNISPSVSKVKKKRTPFKTTKLREETSVTRRLNGCIRCRMQRIRVRATKLAFNTTENKQCPRDPKDPLAPCLSCQGVVFGRIRLPCLRYKITDSPLYRTAYTHYSFFREHVMVGPLYGDFYLERNWKSDHIRVLEVTQDSGAVCSLKIREFVPSAADETILDTRGNRMYAISWATADPDEATAAINEWIDSNMGTYFDYLLDDSNHFVFDVFQIAFRLSMFPKPLKLLHDVLRLWVVCRFLEGRWRCCANDNLGADTLNHHYSDSDFVQVPPYINYQIAALFTERILEPLRRTVLNSLQSLILSNKPTNWYITFLVVFILLHNYELQIRFQRAFAVRRKFDVRFVEMSSIREVHAGAKTILAHFHYCCKGQRPFSREFDWSEPHIRRMAELDEQEVSMLKQYSALVDKQATHLHAVNRTERYEDEYWFLSHLFEADWTPRTPEDTS